jgi:hypothetical protein
MAEIAISVDQLGHLGGGGILACLVVRPTVLQSDVESVKKNLPLPVHRLGIGFVPLVLGIQKV